jgi:hypothetical protein
MSCEAKLHWTSFPLVERPIVSFLLILFLLVLSYLLWNIAVVSWQAPIFYFGGMLLVLGSLLPYFIPTQYYMHEDKIIIKYLFLKVERKYSEFHCFYLDKKGVMLSTFNIPRRLDAFRGQSLRFSLHQQEKEELIQILKNKVGKQY